MAENLKSTSITTLDAAPPVRKTAGEFGSGIVVRATDYVSPGATQTSPSTYRVVRVPSTARNLRVFGQRVGTITTLTGDVTIYYSSQTLDEVGAGQGDSGLVNSLSGASSLFAQAHTFGADTNGAWVELTDLAANYGPTLSFKELWSAAGLTSDPGGFFDVTVVTTATNSLTAGAVLALMVEFLMPYA